MSNMTHSFVFAKFLAQKINFAANFKHFVITAGTKNR